MKNPTQPKPRTLQIQLLFPHKNQRHAANQKVSESFTELFNTVCSFLKTPKTFLGKKPNWKKLKKVQGSC